MNTPNKNTRLVPEPPAELIQEALDGLVRMELEEFAGNLETARCMWRRFREMVEAPEFPEELRSVFVKQLGQEPDDDCGLYGEEALEPGYRESMLPEAIKVARVWMARGRSPRLSPEMQEQHDAKFLSDLGISG